MSAPMKVPMKVPMEVRVMRMAIAFALLAMAACTPKSEPQPEPAAAATGNAAVAKAAEPERKCSDDPRVREEHELPPCGGLSNESAPQAYRVVGGSGDPVDQVVCDIDKRFVLDGKLFGTEFSGGIDGTYKFVRTPNIPGLHWSAGGRSHIELADGPDMPGAMTTEGGGTTTAGSQSRDTTGTEHFTLTPAEACTQ